MNHYLAYHNPDMNPAPAHIEVPGRYIWRRRVHTIQPGDKIWLLTRVGRKYVIHQVYEFGELKCVAGGGYCYLGQGRPRLIEAEITGKPLYRRLLRETANFLNFAVRLNGKTVRLLEAL